MAQEKEFEKKVETYLHSVGVYMAGTPKQKMKIPQVGWYFKVWGGGFQRSGIPDLIGCVNSYFFALELKAERGRPSELQRLNIDRLKESGAYARFLYPKDFDEFKEELNALLP